MKMLLRVSLIVGLVSASLTMVPPAGASFHLIQITEVFTGVAAAPDAQYVELTTIDANQNDLIGTKVVLYDALGVEQSRATFSSVPPNAGDDQAKILVATGDAQTFFDVVSDASLGPASGIAAGGRACFESETGTKIDCVSWGSYDGPSGPTGSPMSPNEGILAGAAIERAFFRAGDLERFDPEDDTNVSKDDFDLMSPRPDGGGEPDELQRIGFGQGSFSMLESIGEVDFPIFRGEPTTGERAVSFSSSSRTATEGGVDYTPADDQQVEFENAETQKEVSATIIDDSAFEGEESFTLKLRNPLSGAVLGDNMTVSVFIQDPEDDNAPPKTRIKLPKQGETYDRANFKKIKGVSDDGPGEVDEVRVGLRRKMKNGDCSWATRIKWVRENCSDGVMRLGTGLKRWRLPVNVKLHKTTGTKVKFYTAYAVATDSQGNEETEFEKNRNANTFELK